MFRVVSFLFCECLKNPQKRSEIIQSNKKSSGGRFISSPLTVGPYTNYVTESNRKRNVT